MITPTKAQIEAAARKLVGVPYAEARAEMDGANCAGIVCLLFAEFAVSIPFPASDVEAVVLESDFSSHFRRIDELGEPPRILDVVKMPGRRGESAHLGVIIEKGRVLHSHRGAGCIITPIGRLKVLEYYRVRALEESGAAQ